MVERLIEQAGRETWSGAMGDLALDLRRCADMVESGRRITGPQGVALARWPEILQALSPAVRAYFKRRSWISKATAS